MEQNSTMNPHEISITVKTQYLPDQSDPDNRQFAFAYTVTIRNTGTASIQLIARHWFITGVVGQQPLLRAGEQFEYTSWATLPTPAGTMRGEYFCVTEEAQFFQAPIPEFALVMPRTLH
jgi:ApaG protein